LGEKEEKIDLEKYEAEERARPFGEKEDRNLTVAIERLKVIQKMLPESLVPLQINELHDIILFLEGFWHSITLMLSPLPRP
jgi:hypothetical protein